MAIITISRGTFSGGQRLAESIAEKLGYRCLARVAIVQQAAKRYGVSEDKITKAIDESPGVLEHLRSDRRRFLAFVRAALVNEVKDDKVVYHGLAGHFLLSGVPNVLKVRVIANMEFRIKAAMDRGHLTREDAKQAIKKMDYKRTRWTKFLYGIDWDDPSPYDLVINLNQISLSSACEIVCHTVSLDSFKTPPGWQKTMGNLTLSTEVKAIIAAHKNIADAGVEIEADGGVITLGGTVASPEHADEIREVVRAIPGVKDINSKMQVRHQG